MSEEDMKFLKENVIERINDYILLSTEHKKVSLSFSSLFPVDSTFAIHLFCVFSVAYFSCPFAFRVVPTMPKDFLFEHE
jgi:hypothetical protein